MANTSSYAMKMGVNNIPTQQLVHTNFAFCSADDFCNFAVPESDLSLVLINGSIVLTLQAHDGMNSGVIALNLIQRRHLKVSTGDFVSVDRFIPPENFELVLLSLELDFVKKGQNEEEFDAALLADHLKARLSGQVVTLGQRVLFEYHGPTFTFTVNQAGIRDHVTADRGMISKETFMVFESSPSSRIKIVNQKQAVSSNIFKQKDFNFEKFGIGGLSAEFTDIFRRAFASRVFPSHVTKKLGIKHIKGMLLYGPPGTGKTLTARQIGKILNAKDPKIVNGPEVLSKFVGETEKNVRDLFADAENEQKIKGDQSQLHIIIFDEIDAICKSRGSTRDGTGVHDSIVNQLLTKIDGVETLNNVLLIGMTNRKDLIDEALLRPGRLEMLVEIGLPDEKGRFEILKIHTRNMNENSFLSPDVDLLELAAKTKNYSGAELEGVVRSATSFALNRQLDLDDLTKSLDEESIKVTMDDFLRALQEVASAFGTSTDDLTRCRLHGMVDCGVVHNQIYQKAMQLVEQVKFPDRCPLISCLLEGPFGSGKTSKAATIAVDSGFPFAKIVSAESMAGLSEASKCAQIIKVFEDAYKSPFSVVILDDIEELVEYTPVGPRYSNLISQTLRVYLKRYPPKGKSILILGTTSEVEFLKSIKVADAFSVSNHVPLLMKADVEKVLHQLNVFAECDIEMAAVELNGKPIKKLFMLVGMGAQGPTGTSAEAIYSGIEKINIDYFLDCLGDF